MLNNLARQKALYLQTVTETMICNDCLSLVLLLTRGSRVVFQHFIIVLQNWPLILSFESPYHNQLISFKIIFVFHRFHSLNTRTANSTEMDRVLRIE